MVQHSKTIVLGADHAAVALKARLGEYLSQQGYDVVDIGTHSEASVDYPLIAETFANTMRERNIGQGVLCCGSGVGVSIAANRFPHIRAVLAGDETTARLSRQHNDANVLCLGARLVAPELAVAILRTWLDTAFEGDRHQRRVDQLTQLTQSCSSVKGASS